MKREVELTIDGVACDVGASPKVKLNFHADELQRVKASSKGVVVRLEVPATATNDLVFSRAMDPRTAVCFNDTEHAARIRVDGATIASGRVKLMSASADGYTLEIETRTPTWHRDAAQRMFNELDIPFAKRLTPAMITGSWTSDEPVKFFPVHNEAFPEAGGVDDYHPFISIPAIVKEMFRRSGYTLRSDFFDSQLCSRLYMSGAYAARDTSTQRKNMDFLARRTANATTTADSIGRVYAQPYASANSIGGVVQAAEFANNRCFSIVDGECRFTPIQKTTVGFEFKLHYLTTHRIASRTRLTGFDSVYLGDGTELRQPISNTFVDRRSTVRANTQYRAFIFDHVAGRTYKIFNTEFSTRSCLVTASGDATLYYKSGNSFTPYTGDWALYDSHIGETGQSEVTLTVRTHPVAMEAGSTKHFSGIYFFGAEAGMSFTLLSDSTLRPDFSSAPGLNAEIYFADIARHRIRQIEVLDALRHMFNLCIFTDEESRTVYVEPMDDFYSDTAASADWSDKVAPTEPVVVRDLACEVERLRTFGYRAEDRAVAAHDSGLGRWTVSNASAAAIPDERTLLNPLFAPTTRLDGVLCVDETGSSDRHDFSPRIVYYGGVEQGRPLVFFALSNGESANLRNGLTLGFENLNARIIGLHRYYDTLIERQYRGKEITLRLRLDPLDIENLFHARHIASVFRLLVDGQHIDCLLRAIDDYDPSEEFTKCTFVTV